MTFIDGDIPRCSALDAGSEKSFLEAAALERHHQKNCVDSFLPLIFAPEQIFVDDRDRFSTI